MSIHDLIILTRKVEDLEAQLEVAKEALGIAVRWNQSHYECDDGWYSCPLAENYFSESNQGQRGVCNCGKDDFDKVREALAKLEGK